MSKKRQQLPKKRSFFRKFPVRTHLKNRHWSFRLFRYLHSRKKLLRKKLQKHSLKFMKKLRLKYMKKFSPLNRSMKPISMSPHFTAMSAAMTTDSAGAMWMIPIRAGAANIGAR